MHRFFLSADTVNSKEVSIKDAGQSHHLRDVLRVKRGEEIILVDRRGKEYLCSVQSSRPQVVLAIKKKIPGQRTKKKISLTLACSLPKNSNIDDIINKLTQLGVDRIIPLESERVVVRLDDKKKQLRLKRWEKIVLAASQQCQRNRLPFISPVLSFKDLIQKETGYDLKLIPTLAGERRPLLEVLGSSRPCRVLALVGPEGDFSDEEINLAKQKGFIPISLGDLVLRVETAAVAVAGFIMLYDSA